MEKQTVQEERMKWDVWIQDTGKGARLELMQVLRVMTARWYQQVRLMTSYLTVPVAVPRIQFNSIQFIYSNQIIHVMMTFKKIDI